MEKNHEELVEILAEAWKNLDASELLNYIHPDFQYDSQWVFRSMYGDEYPGYITGQFRTIKNVASKVEVSIVYDNVFYGGTMVKLVQDETRVGCLRIKTKDGKISKMDMCMF
ncbi:MAG: hypothetical protein IJU26_03940 [Synergistaceae bacterium]|nr:hypothetical protein [Synergistaceae bacterium]